MKNEAFNIKFRPLDFKPKVKTLSALEEKGLLYKGGNLPSYAVFQKAMKKAHEDGKLNSEEIASLIAMEARNAFIDLKKGGKGVLRGDLIYPLVAKMTKLFQAELFQILDSWCKENEIEFKQRWKMEK